MSACDGLGMGGRVNWVKVTEVMSGTRSAQQCNQRWHATLKPRMEGGIRFGQWSQDEVNMHESNIYIYVCMCQIAISISG